MISKTEKYRLNQIQEELEAYFTTIRGRDISKNDGTLTLYSLPKEINLVILRVNLRYSREVFDSTWKSLWTFLTFSS